MVQYIAPRGIKHEPAAKQRNAMTKITGKTSDCARFRAASPLFAKAMDFLCRPDVATLAPGRHEIDGDRCWANVQDATLVPPGERKLEAHRKYVDVQAPLTGPETIGVAEMDAAALALLFLLSSAGFWDTVPADGEYNLCGHTGGPVTI